MEALRLTNAELKVRLEGLLIERERAMATVAEYLYENDTEIAYFTNRINELKEIIAALRKELKAYTAASTAQSTGKPEDTGDGSEEGLEYDEGGIKAGTLERLVEGLWADTTNNGQLRGTDYVKVFLLTYRSFATPREVLDILMAGYDNLVARGVEATKAGRLRIGGFFKKWVDNNFHDFNDEQDLIADSIAFVDRMAKVDPMLAKSVRSSLDAKLQGTIKQMGAVTFTEPPPKPIYPKGTPTSVLDINSKELARQLTIKGYKLCKAIEPKECLGLAFAKPDKEKRSPNLLKMIKDFNMALHEFNNFNAIFSIVGGLGSVSVFRLTKSFAQIRPEKKRFLEEMNVLTNPNKSWANYRNRIHQVNPPCVPFMGIYQTDLTFIEDGNPDKFASGLINFKKCRLISAVIEEIQQYQLKPYNLTEVKEIQQFIENEELEAQNYDDKKLYDLSLLAEPRT